MLRVRGSIFRRLVAAIIGCGFITLPTLPVQAAGSVAVAVPVSGGYKVKIGGWVTGDGTANVTTLTVSITGTVTDESGNTGEFTANSLKIDEKNHFKGTGKVLGKAIDVDGRLDPASSGEGELKTVRLVCNYLASGTSGSASAESDVAGRVVGFVPVPAGTLPPAQASGTDSGSNGTGSNGGSNGSGGGSVGGTGSGSTGGTGNSGKGTGKGKSKANGNGKNTGSNGSSGSGSGSGTGKSGDGNGSGKTGNPGKSGGNTGGPGKKPEVENQKSPEPTPKTGSNRSIYDD